MVLAKWESVKYRNHTNGLESEVQLGGQHVASSLMWFGVLD